MLVGESQGLDLQEPWLPQHTVDVNAQGVCRQFGIGPGTQAPKSMRMIDLDMENLR